MIARPEPLFVRTQELTCCDRRSASSCWSKQTIRIAAKDFKGKPNKVFLCPDNSIGSHRLQVPEPLNSSASLFPGQGADPFQDDYQNKEFNVETTTTMLSTNTTRLQSTTEEEEAAEALIACKMSVDENHLCVSLLKECAEQKDLVKGRRIHDDIIKRGLLHKSVTVGTALITMYAKCGSLQKAQEECDNLPVRDETSWNSLITGYAQYKKGAEAVRCYERMRRDGLSPNSITYSCILKAIGSIAAAGYGKETHSQIVKEGFLENHVVVGTALVDMYAKCGLLAESQDVFNQLGCRNTISCNALIAGYARCRNGEQALSVYKQMQLEGFSPSKVTYTCILKACGSIRATKQGQEIHAEIVKKGLLENEVVVSNALIDLYGKCGQLTEARMVFNQLPARDRVSYSSLIAGYAEQGYGEEALQCYEQMQQEGLSPDAVTFVCILKACIVVNVADKCEGIHSQIVRDGLLEKDLIVGGALVDMYAKRGLLCKAQEVFDKLPVRNVVAYSALIAGYVQHGSAKEALDCFERMKIEGLVPNVLTFVCILRACADVGAADLGEDIHKQFLKQEWLENNVILVTALMDMYANFGSLAKAQEAFDKLLVRDTVAWNALIAGYARHEFGEKALFYFERMQSEGVVPDEFTFSCVLKACASIEATVKGQEIHALVVRMGDMEIDVTVGTALLDMYAKCGLLAESQVVFDKLEVHNAVSWNALMGGYSQHGHADEALECFQQMQLEGFSPSAATFIAVLKACGSIGAVYKGQELHAEIDRERLLQEDVGLGIALADMYTNCGLLEKAQDVLNRLRLQDAISWNVVMAGYAQLGETKHVISAFEKMQREGVTPGLLTFTTLLNSCSHAGLLDKGQMYFEAMSTDYGLFPASMQHACMVDLFCRAGLLEKAVSVMKEMPLGADLTAWVTLLNACQSWGDMELGKFAFYKGAQPEHMDAAAYICISNVFAGAGR